MTRYFPHQTRYVNVNWLLQAKSALAGAIHAAGDGKGLALIKTFASGTGHFAGFALGIDAQTARFGVGRGFRHQSRQIEFHAHGGAERGRDGRIIEGDGQDVDVRGGGTGQPVRVHLLAAGDVIAVSAFRGRNDVRDIHEQGVVRRQNLEIRSVGAVVKHHKLGAGRESGAGGVVAFGVFILRQPVEQGFGGDGLTGGRRGRGDGAVVRGIVLNERRGGNGDDVGHVRLRPVGGQGENGENDCPRDEFVDVFHKILLVV